MRNFFYSPVRGAIVSTNEMLAPKSCKSIICPMGVRMKNVSWDMLPGGISMCRCALITCRWFTICVGSIESLATQVHEDGLGPLVFSGCSCDSKWRCKTLFCPGCHVKASAGRRILLPMTVQTCPGFVESDVHVRVPVASSYRATSTAPDDCKRSPGMYSEP